MLYAYPKQGSIKHFKDQIRKHTRRKVPLNLQELIKQLNPIIRGWGNYYCRAHIRRLFKQLKGWIVRRIWSHQLKKVAQCRLEDHSKQKAIRRIWARKLSSSDTFFISSPEGVTLRKRSAGKPHTPFERRTEASL